MSEKPAEELVETLTVWARDAADLMARWGLNAHDGFLASQSVLALQGYPVAPESGWEQRFELHIDRERLPWTPQEADGEELAVPDEFRPLTPGDRVPLRLYSTRKYSLPVTFLKPLMFEEDLEIHLISPRGIARLYMVDKMHLIRQQHDPTDDQKSWLERGSDRLRYLSERPWPRRDRWFAKFCTESLTIRDSILDGSPPRPSQMEKFGRRFAVV